MKIGSVGVELFHSGGRTNKCVEAGSRFSQMLGERARKWVFPKGNRKTKDKRLQYTGRRAVP